MLTEATIRKSLPRRIIRAPRGPERTCKGWIQEAALRMLMNNLDPEVAEDPDRLVVYGGSGLFCRERSIGHVEAQRSEVRDCTGNGEEHDRHLFRAEG